MDGHQFRGARIHRDMMLVSSVCRRALGCEWGGVRGGRGFAAQSTAHAPGSDSLSGPAGGRGRRFTKGGGGGGVTPPTLGPRSGKIWGFLGSKLCMYSQPAPWHLCRFLLD